MGTRTTNGAGNFSHKRLTQIVHDRTTYTFLYDRFGNRTQTKVGDYTLSDKQYAANNGMLQSETYGNGHVVSYKYDDFGNVREKLYNGQTAATYQTDSRGAVVRKNDLRNNRQTDFVVDATGRLVRTQITATASREKLFTAEYGYDKNNNVDKLAILSGGSSFVNQYTYGKDNLPEKYIHSSGKTITYGYDGLNRLTSKTLDTERNLEIKYTYDSSARNAEGETLYTTSRIKTETTPLGTFTYTYDSRGNVTQIKNSNGSTQTYKYDGMNQLTEESNSVTGKRYTYRYDQNGNLIQKRLFEDGNDQYREDEYGYNDPQWPDKLTHHNGDEFYLYDEIGNPVLYDEDLSMEWEGRRLMKLLNETYTYDDAGLRTSKTFQNGDVHNYEYLNGKLMVERRPDVTMQFSYDALGNPAAITRVFTDGRTDTHYYLVNSFGDVTALYDEDGNIKASYVYNAWGEIERYGNFTGADSIQTMNPLRYRGYYFENDTSGFYYLQSRYYDPVMGRFINADDRVLSDDIQGTNVFMYCGNNPVLNVDPEGTCYYENYRWKHIQGCANRSAPPTYMPAGGSGNWIPYGNKYGTKDGKPLTNIMSSSSPGNKIQNNAYPKYHTNAVTKKAQSKSLDNMNVFVLSYHMQVGNVKYFMENPGNFLTFIGTMGALGGTIGVAVITGGSSLAVLSTKEIMLAIFGGAAGAGSFLSNVGDALNIWIEMSEYSADYVTNKFR